VVEDQLAVIPAEPEVLAVVAAESIDQVLPVWEVRVWLILAAVGAVVLLAVEVVLE
jgi:hypothetical protein